MKTKSLTNEKQSFNIIEWAGNNVIPIVLFIILIGIIIIEPSFLSIKNLTNILAQCSTRMIIALGIGGIIVTQGTDLSAGRIIGLAAVVSASLLQATDYAYRMYPNLQKLPVVAVILFVMIICGIMGGINGFAVAKLKTPPFIATMGTMLLAYGITSLYFDRPPYGAQPIAGLDKGFKQLAVGGFQLGEFRLPYLIIYAVIACIIMWLIWNKTKLGKNMFAIGGNPEAAEVSGVNVVRNLIIIYVMAGLLYGLAGSLEAARVGSATNNTGLMYEMDAIAACVVGGVSFSGGIGSIGGIITGVLIFQVLNYGLSFIGVSTYLQFIIKGVIIIAAVALDTRKYMKKK
ncbi:MULTISPECIES: galactose/methyl galactoside ABC transporter permease MglC [unclassified Romboutsia]|uniref:galactose/methyl galactoside ABC transporter permease MglC n=1 Tax=unclassified Romboutsia TaxID=2626894 RepID=UPI0008210CEE|nr:MULTISPECIES: galactose/methyl galactoside ABC transporter permease MglC [unclassified Romboutsia]SCH36024.1 Galactoside transport system permease protein mglC [uncultured Clostridium sp.]